MATQYMPVWDGRQPWDGEPISVKLEDWSEFVRVNQVEVVRPIAADGVGWDVEVVFTHEVNDVDEGTAGMVGRGEAVGEERAVEQRAGEGAVGSRCEERKAGKNEAHQIGLWDGVEDGGVGG
jgi:hypothetical protein